MTNTEEQRLRAASARITILGRHPEFEPRCPRCGDAYAARGVTPATHDAWCEAHTILSGELRAMGLER